MIIAGYRLGNQTFYCSLKTMFTTMERLRERDIVKSFKNPPNNNDTSYAIVRSPYSRLESFYRDKMIKAVTQDLNQACQRAISELFGRERVVKKDISFQEFIITAFQKGLPLKLEKKYYDSHLMTQSSFMPDRIDRIIHIENPEEMSELSEILGVRLTEQKHNHTDDIDCDMTWTPEMREIVRKFYQIDFERFGYQN